MNFYITRCVCLFARYILLGYVLESFVFLKHNNRKKNTKQMFSMHANQTRNFLSSSLLFAMTQHINYRSKSSIKSIKE